MDLAQLAAELRPDIQDNSKSIDALLPKQQTTRSYGTIETKPEKLTCSLERFQFGDQGGKMLLVHYIRWWAGDPQQKTATQEQLVQFAHEYLVSNSNISFRDIKTVKIISVNRRQVIYQWDIEEWFKLNFNNKKPEFKLPMTFIFKYKEFIPSFISARIPETDLRNYISSRFMKWLDYGNRIKVLQTGEFQFVKKLVSALFDYIVDMQRGEIRVTLKQSVLVAGFVAATYKSNKDKFNNRDSKRISKGVNSLMGFSKLMK